MHLMYTLDGNGNRAYTLKVRVFIYRVELRPFMTLQKVTDEGRITKSAHPGTFVPWTLCRFASKTLAQLAFPQMTSFLATVSRSKSAMEFCPLNFPLSPCKDVGSHAQL